MWLVFQVLGRDSASSPSKAKWGRRWSRSHQCAGGSLGLEAGGPPAGNGPRMQATPTRPNCGPKPPEWPKSVLWPKPPVQLPIIIGVQVTPSQSEMARWPLIVTHLSALNKVWHGASNRQRDLRKDKSKILSCTSFALFTDGRMQSCTFPTGIPVHTNFCSWVSTLTTLSTGYLESTMFPLSSENNHIWENYHLSTESDSQHV